MCGIAGIIGLNNRIESEVQIRKMTDAIAHRGPDDSGIYTDDHIAFGHRRLAIIDLSPAGHQPMWDSTNKLVIIFNGEIYNFKQIKSELSGYPFRSQSDTEVLLAAYQKWGPSMVDRLAGMFALAIHDTEKRETFLARDRMGIKPLYYYTNEEWFVFASEIRAIIKSGLLQNTLNKEALYDYFSYQTIHAPETILKNVFCLMPGHYATIKQGQFETQRYWSPQSNFSNLGFSHTYNEIKTTVRQLLYQAVQRRLVSDVDFGAFLSGGIDSSIIVGIMSEVHDKPIKTFNVSFDESEFSESRYANIISKKFNTVHTEIKLNPELFLESLPDALAAMDHPSGDGPNSYIVSKATRNSGITMALSGLGGDELFAGYPVFKRMYSNKLLSLFLSLPYPLKQLIASAFHICKPGAESKKILQLSQIKNNSFEDLYPVWRKISSHSQIQKLLPQIPFQKNSVLSIVQNEPGMWDKNTNLKLSKISIAEMCTYMQNILLRDTDQMSMAVALEVRVPFLDHDLIEYVLGISDSYKFPSFPKKLLIESVSDLLPPEIIHREKMGFVLPWEHWLKNELHSYANKHIESLANRSFINGPELIQRWNTFNRKQYPIRWNDMWICIVLEDWLQKNEIQS